MSRKIDEQGSLRPLDALQKRVLAGYFSRHHETRDVPLLIGLAAGGAYLLWATRLPQCTDSVVVELAQNAVSEMWVIGDVSEVVESSEETSDKERAYMAKIANISSPFWVKYTVENRSGNIVVRLLPGKALR